MMDGYEKVVDCMNFYINKLYGTVCSRDEEIRKVSKFIWASCKVGIYWTVEDRQSIGTTGFSVDLK
jgi:hypothetical protein